MTNKLTSRKTAEKSQSYQIAKGKEEITVFEPKSIVEKFFWQYPLSFKDNGIEFTEKKPYQKEWGGGKEKRSSEYLAKGFAELVIGKGFWSGTIHRSGDVLIFYQINKYLNKVLNAYPGKPLFAGTYW